MIFIRLLFVAILAFPAAATAQQQNVSKQDVVRLLEKLQLEQNNPDALEGLGFRGEKLDLMLDHGQKLAQNRVILEFMADKLIGAQSGAQPADALGGLMTPLLRRGMPYLPIKEQRYFLNVEFTGDAGHEHHQLRPFCQGNDRPPSFLRAALRSRPRA